ncbi:mesoderm induction early response protein 1-like isoform X2 [Dermacentor andersoni]|uniref:mesoderm induction early response protein 1-like isoform X2 n=1 Tax=Dermacentor andersoni TaxID=34620 RepID=UPI002155E2D9|nr:mesoderm induction early response protein 1-like isoform X2 [Dermacentor andersoni]
MAEANTSDGSADSDQDFDPSAEMLVDEFDDEKTLDEEEALESDASDDELNTLQKEGEMPLEDLLAMFGYKDGERVGGEPESEEEEEDSDEEEEEDGDTAEEVPESSAPKVAADKPVTEAPNKEPVPMLAPKEVPPCAAVPTLVLPPPVEAKVPTTTKTPSPVTRATPTPPHPPPRREHRTTSTAHLLRSVSHASESSNSDSDEDFTLEEYWKKNSNFSDVNILGPAYARVPHQTIQVGSEYQATIPVGLCKYDDAPAYENEDRLLWDPAKLSDSDVEDYLSTAQEPTANTMGSINSLPLGSHTRDDEQALYLLLQCGHNVEEALRRRRMNPTIPTKMSLWSEEECRSFESGLRLYGKDFHLIQLHKVRTRSVGELVHFYYLWKKTERHDIFASKVRLEKKKYALHPGTTDYMDRFLDEQENSQQQQQQQQPRDRSTSPNEAKRPRLALPMQLTSQLVGPQENGREASAAASLTVATDPTRENGRDRLWTAPASSSDEDDLPLIATTARPTLGKVAVTVATPAAAPSGNVVQVLNKMAATNLVTTVSATQPLVGVTERPHTVVPDE